MKPTFLYILVLIPIIALAAVPDAPSVRLYSYDTSRIVFTYDPPGNNGGSALTSCNVYMREGTGSYLQISTPQTYGTLAYITTFNGQPLKAVTYDIYGTATNAFGTSLPSTVLTFTLGTPTSPSKSGAVSPPASVMINTPFTLTIQAYDDAGNKKTTGGDYMAIEVQDACEMRGYDYRCFRVGAGNAHYNPDILNPMLKSDLVDHGDGTYTATFTIPSVGYVTVSPIIFRQGACRTDVYFADCSTFANGYWATYAYTWAYYWGSTGDFPGGRGCMYSYMHCRIRPPYSTYYYFYGNNDDGFWMWINNNMALNSPCCGAHSGGYPLDKHGIYDVYMEFNEQGGPGNLYLDWAASGYYGQTALTGDYMWYPLRVGPAPFDIKVTAPPTSYKCYLVNFPPGTSVSEDTIHTIQIQTVWDVASQFAAMPDNYEISIIGPNPLTTETKYTASLVSGGFQAFNFILADPGQYQLSIKLAGQHIQNSPLTFTVYPCHKYCVGCNGVLNTQCVACNQAEKAFPAVGNPSTCDICHPGYHGDLIQNICAACDIGFYQDEEKADTCKECEVGKYQPLTGKASCIPCPLGKVQPLTGQSICNDCLPGEYMPEEGKTQCLLCAKGKFSPIPGQSSCTDCIPGEYQNEEGKSSCVPCAAGTYSPTPGYVDCLPCEIGKYQDLTGKTTCIQCTPGHYMPTTGAKICLLCPEGLYTDVYETVQCKACKNTWYPNVNHDDCLYKGMFADLNVFFASPMAENCFYQKSVLIKPFTPTCRNTYRDICCVGSSKSTLIHCNYGLESLSTSMQDRYCSACKFMDQSQCPADGVCWNDATWTDNNVSPYPDSYTVPCLHAIAPYCGKLLNANINDFECGQFVPSCLGKVTNSAYMSWDIFRITFDKPIPATLPNCNQIFNSTTTPIVNSGELGCYRASDYAIDVSISRLAGPMNNFSFTKNFLTDACGIYLQENMLKNVTPPNPASEYISLTGSSTDKCMGLNIRAIVAKPYLWPMQNYFWEVFYEDTIGVTVQTVDRLTKIGNFNKNNITVPDYDLVPDKLLFFKVRAVNLYNTNIISDYYNVTVPKIASGKRYCGPCQLNDRAKCVQFNNICWKDFLNYTVIDPFNSTECLKAMAPVCYSIWNYTSFDDPQCLDFKQFYNFTAMKIKPLLKSANYSSNGKFISLEFNEQIQQSQWYDCSSIFDATTTNWLPQSKSCRWTGPKILVVDYEPQIGIMQQLTIKSKSFYYDYEYAQESSDQTTLQIKLPPLDATLKITGITAVSECDTVNLFGTIVTPTLYPLSLKWEVTFEPALTEPILSEANTYFTPLKEFGKISSISIPSKMLKRGSKITATLSAKAANFDSNIISASTTINIFGDIPKIKFTSKSQFVVEVNGNKSTPVPMLIDNTKCVLGDQNAPTELIPIDVTFTIASGDTAESITTKGSEETSIEGTLLTGYAKFKSLFVGNKYGFKYLKYYNLTAIVTSKDDGSKNSDSIILYIIKPPIKSVIDSPGTLVSINANVELSGINSEFPALENDAKSYAWKCISATSMALGGVCECPIITDSSLTVANLIIPKEKLVNMCKLKFSLTVKATVGTYSRTAYNETEFMTFEGPAASMKAKLMEGSNPEVSDMYLTFGTDASLGSGTSSTYKWALAEVESTDPQIQEKYSERNTFIYDFFKNELNANVDPAMKQGDVNIPSGSRRRLADVAPNYITPTTTRILGIDKSGLLPLYKYTFAVTVYSGATPTFLFIQFAMPPAPRPRQFSVQPTTGIAFSTQFAFTFTLQSTTDVDEAYYQLFRKNCPDSTNDLSAISSKFSHSNSYTSMFGPGLQSCNNNIEIILRIYEYNSYIDVKTTITVSQPTIPVEQVLSQQAQSLTQNADLTMDQKLSIMAELSNVPVTESTPEFQITTTIIMAQIQSIDEPGGILDMLEPKEQVSLLGTATETLADLVVSQQPNVDLSAASSITDQVDGYLTKVKTKEGGSYIIPTALAALSGVADIGTTQQSETKFFAAMQEAMGKMTDMKLAEMLPGSAPYKLDSPSISMIVAKNNSDDYNKTQTFETREGVNILMPDGVADMMIKSMNKTSINGSVTFGASVYATSFNPFTNIKNSTNITMSSLSPASLNGFLNTTIQRIYEDMHKGMLENIVNKREQAADLIQLAFKPFELHDDASENQINTSVRIGDLPPGKEAIFSIPAPENMSKLVNNSIMVPLYYIPEKEIWSNENCSLDQPSLNSTNLTLRCNHMGKGEIKNINDGFSVTVDVVKDVFKVIKAGNYQQLTNLNVLLAVTPRTIAAYISIASIAVFIVLVVMLLIRMDRTDIYNLKVQFLFKRFSPKPQIIQTGSLHNILQFFSTVRKKGMSKVSKKNQKEVEPEQNQVVTTEQKMAEAKKTEPLKKANGFNRLSAEDKQELLDAFNLYKQVSMIYDNDDITQIMNVELEHAKVLSRLTQAYVDDMVLYEPATFWMLMKDENEIFNAIFKTEITTPRPLKFLVFCCVLIGELFVTGFFYNPEETATISDNASRFVNTAIVYSLAATVLMIPLKIIISVFMTGKGLSEDMKREEIESAEKSGPLFKLIGLVMGFAWLGFSLYSIMMYIITFTDVALDNWLTTYGISVFTELVIITQLKVLLKVLIGLILMKIAKSKAMMSTAGVIASEIVDRLMKIFQKMLD